MSPLYFEEVYNQGMDEQVKWSSLESTTTNSHPLAK
jgi:hypothetical protein